MNVLDLLLKKHGKVSLRELAFFCRKTAFLLDAGLPVKTALPILAEQATGHVLSVAVSDLHSMVMQGESFSHALKSTGVFPAFMCGYAAIGERAAKLPETFEKLADYYEARVQTEEELVATMIYPIAVTVMMLGVMIMAITFVLPGYSRIFDASGVALPAFTAGLLSVSDFLSKNAFAVFGGILFFMVACVLFLRSAKGQNFSAFMKIKIPIIRQNINLNITQAISLLLSSGLSISEALPMSGEIINNPIVKKDLEKVCAKVNSGAALWEALGEISYINPLLTGLVRVGEETGSLPQTLEKCNMYFETSYRHAIRRMNKFIEPAITLVLGILLAAVMLAVILPTFELATAV
jgi:type IV pilus assembly protein PilC